MVTGLEPALIGATGQLLKKPFEDFYGSCAAGVKSFATSWIAAGAIDKLEQRIVDLERIRTIVSRQVSTLSEIYYPANVKYKKQTVGVHSIASIDPDRNILITGTAGQGKSVLMRYLAVQELRGGRRVPLFVELRHIDQSKSLIELLKYQLSLQSESYHDELLGHLLNRGNVVLFLDGFDEVPREFALGVRDKVAELVVKYKKIQVIISSRPGALCAHVQDLPRILAVEIAELSESDFEPFLRKIGTEDVVLKRLLGAIHSSSTQVRQLLKTPLMLTLLVLTCGGKQQIPDTLPEFYDSLFRVLALMHDETKPGYVREMATRLSYSELEQVFECFSFVSREKFDKTSLSPSQFAESLQEATSYTERECTVEGFKADVTETVCLMVREGLDTTFIHKSIQEYYAARFIKSLPDDETAHEAYSAIDGSRLHSWTGELRFLEQIDPIRYKLFFRKPQIERFLRMCDYKPTARKPITKSALKTCLRYFHAVMVHSHMRILLSPIGLDGIDSQLIWEIVPLISQAVGKVGGKNASGSYGIHELLSENKALHEELEQVFAKKISESISELDEIANAEQRRRTAVINILKRKRPVK